MEEEKKQRFPVFSTISLVFALGAFVLTVLLFLVPVLNVRFGGEASDAGEALGEVFALIFISLPSLIIFGSASLLFSITPLVYFFSAARHATTKGSKGLYIVLLSLSFLTAFGPALMLGALMLFN